MEQPESLRNVDTHWSRALYYDFFEAQADDKEKFVAPDRSRSDAGSTRTPAHTAVNRLAIFIAIYSAVAFAVHFLFWPAAAASAPDYPQTAESTAASPNPSSAAGQWSPDDSIEVTRICKPSAAVESMSLYD